MRLEGSVEHSGPVPELQERRPDRQRSLVVVALALSYPIVWVGAGVVAFLAGRASDNETDTTGLGDALTGFGIGAVVFSLLWALGALLGLRRFGHPVRSGVVAFGAPALVIAGLFVSLPLGVVLAALLPAAGSWWATTRAS